MRYRLVHLSGSLAGRVREIDAAEVVLGRDPSAQVVFGPEEPAVSRRHAALREDGEALILYDLDSSTGTFLDGHDIEEAEIVDGDVFELGPGGPRVRVELAREEGTIAVSAPLAMPVPVPPPMAAPGKAPPARRVPARAGPDSKLRLTFRSGTRAGSALDLGGAVVRLGRGQGNTVWMPEDRVVSAQHAKIVRLEDAYVLIDLESRNGTYLNGARVERSPLADGDLIGLGPGGPEIVVEVLSPDRAAAAAVPGTVVIPHFADLAARPTPGVPLRDVDFEGDVLLVGRGPGAGLALDSPIVSRRHARLTRTAEGLTVEDLDSTNGTYVGGTRIERALLKDGDDVVIGPFRLRAVLAADAPPRLRLLDTRNRARLDARGLVVRAGSRVLLEGVSLALAPGTFTAIIGPSGAGKSTLLGALSGARPADEGEVLLNGADLYRSFAALKSTLGYVPQDDIVHRELTVAQSLDYTARLRLPADTTGQERRKRVADVLASLELTERRDVPIHRLSGGQRKRVSMATELLTEPNLLFLDEPTSGLDPGLEEALMLLLRELSYKGKTVVLVTHTLDNIHLCDDVVLLVEGRLAFFGPAAAARDYFHIDHMVNLYARLKERPSEAWRAAFAESEGHASRIAAPLKAVPGAGPAKGPGPAAPARATPAPPPGGASRQAAILTSRYVRTMARDAKNAALLLAQAPLIAGLIGLSLLYGPSEIAYTKPKNTILFLLALTAVWFGCSNAARELVKERSIYLRERMVNLGVGPYLASKVVVLGAIALVQCVAFLVILDLWFGIPGRFALLMAGMALASLVGILLGLALSAVVGTADRAMTLLPILLIPQVLFTIPSVQMDMKGEAGLVARAMPTWWGYDLLRRVALAPDEGVDDDAIEKRLEEGGPVLMTKRRFESMLQQGYMMFQYRGAIETTWTASLPERLGARLPARLGAWRPAVVDAGVLAAMAGGLFAAAAFAQRRHDTR